MIPKYRKRQPVKWLDIAGETMTGMITDPIIIEMWTYPEWVIELLPRFLWFLFSVKAREPEYTVYGSDGRRYSLSESTLELDND